MTIPAILLLATLVEGFVEYATGKVSALDKYRIYIALVLGVVAALAYRVSIFAALNVPLEGIYPWVDYVVSGLIIGRGSNYLNTLVSLGVSTTKNNIASAKVKVDSLGGARAAKSIKLDTLHS